MPDPDLELYTDGSSSVINGQRASGYAVTTVTNVIEAEPLSPSVSAQKTELIALTRALELSKEKKVNIWTDLKYVFRVIHAHGAIWKERGLLTSQGTAIKHKEEVLRLLESVQLPAEVAVMYCKAHQTGDSEQQCGNRLADEAAKRAARKGITIGVQALVPERQLDLPEHPIYDNQDLKLIEKLEAEKKVGGL